MKTIATRNVKKIKMNAKNAAILYMITARNTKKSAMNANVKAVMNAVVMNTNHATRTTTQKAVKKAGMNAAMDAKLIQVLSRR